jgi:hypothetical protein
MSDSTFLVGLLDRAIAVFSQAHELGHAFLDDHKHQRGQLDAEGWEERAPKFDAFAQSVLELRDVTQVPPAGFAFVADCLQQANELVERIRTSTIDNSPPSVGYSPFFSDLYDLARSGLLAVRTAKLSVQDNEPNASNRNSNEIGSAIRPITTLDQFPTTTVGHIRFLESVLREVEFAARKIRDQSKDNSSNERIESIIRGIKWLEANHRINLLSELSPKSVELVYDVLRRELNAGTAEQIAHLLTPAVRGLRDAWEELKANRNQVANQSITVLGDSAPQLESTPQDHKKGNRSTVRNDRQSRRGAKGESAAERLANIRILARELAANEHKLSDETIALTMRKAKQWLGVHTDKNGSNRWDDTYKDSGKTWWEVLTESDQKELFELRTYLLDFWKSAGTKKGKAPRHK